MNQEKREQGNASKLIAFPQFAMRTGRISPFFPASHIEFMPPLFILCRGGIFLHALDDHLRQFVLMFHDMLDTQFRGLHCH